VNNRTYNMYVYPVEHEPQKLGSDKVSFFLKKTRIKK
jgi:hypothetical protein